VRFLADAPPPSFADRKFFAPDALRAGYRLACTARPATDCTVEVCFEEETETEVVTWSGLEAGQIHARGGPLFCAVDLGTTTVGMQLVEQGTGAVLASCGFGNPQRAYGVDVLSRITAAEEGRAGALREAIVLGLEEGIRKLERHGQPEKIVIAGNTTMGHLLLGYPAGGLGRAPFTPWHIGSTHFWLGGYPAVFLPGVSAFVGADIVAGIYACGMAREEELSLFIDLGTNGEMAMGNRERILCTATAAGCAFEGSVSAGGLGSDMTAVAFDMLQRGIMDETGLLSEPWFTEGYRTGNMTVCQQDIRNLQMAKAAICQGARVLLDRAGGAGRLSHVYLAGGFGYYLDVDKAVGIGLIPAPLRGKCRAVGNASLAGAVRYGREEDAQEELEHIVAISKSINLAKEPAFGEGYIDAMTFAPL